VTFHRDVQPILQRSCQECHRPGEVGPFPLLTYDDARKSANRMKAAVEQGRMPPWHASGGSWKNDRRLTKAEIETISKWVDGECPEGDRKDSPAPRTFTDGWKIGKPDLVIQMPRPAKVKAEGTMPYKYVFVRTGLTEDKWVQAIEVRPGNRQVVHHILVFVQSKENSDLAEFAGGLEGYFGIMVPGEDPTVFPEGCAKKLPAGSRIVFQIHYTPIGEAQEDRSSVGLVFAKEKPKREMITKGIHNENLKIPPGAANHVETASWTAEEDIEIHSYLPHLHLRGKSFRYEAIYPDKRTEVLLDVPKYDFNWQTQYRPREPKFLPKGTRIRLTASYDNSKENPANPDPTKWVYFGEQTNEEMLIGYVDYARR
jgi:hypothetical protein